MIVLPGVKDCFISAKKYKEKGRKHKGLLLVEQDHERALEYIKKAKENLQWCEIYKEKGADYKLPEEWFYTMYYCALSILSKFGVESRSQKCTALLLRYLKDAGLIDLNDGFINRMTVYSELEKKSAVDEREEARYGSKVKNGEIVDRYETMMECCKECIAQTEEIVFSKRKFIVPQELQTGNSD